MFEEILEFIEKTNKKHALTLREVSEFCHEEEKKVAPVLKKMRKAGIIAFEKREIQVVVNINYTKKEEVGHRTHKMEPYHYWGVVAK